MNEMNTAGKSICIVIAWFTNKELFTTLLHLLKKGISIELIVNDDKINTGIDGLHFNAFILLGGKLYFANNSKLMHHKFMIIDDEKLISGSYNWTYRAEYNNTENIIVLNYTSIIEQFKKSILLLKK